MQISESHATEAEGKVTGGDVQTSQALRRNEVIGDIGDQFLRGTTVRFRPGERTRYHRHDNGQMLIVTDGTGICGTEEEQIEVNEGDLIFFEPHEVHWHGTKPGGDDIFEHISIVLRDEPDKGCHAVRDLDIE